MKSPETFDSAVLVSIDTVNSFMPGGELPVKHGNEVVKPTNTVAEWVRSHNGRVVFAREQHPPVTNHFSDKPNFTTTFPPHGITGTDGAKFHPELDVRVTDTIINKGNEKDKPGFSAFDGQTANGVKLETILTPRRGKSIAAVFTGLATEFCDRAALLDGQALAQRLPRDRYLGIFAVTDAMRPVDPAAGLAALEEMKQAGIQLITSQELVSGQAIRIRGQS